MMGRTREPSKKDEHICLACNRTVSNHPQQLAIHYGSQTHLRFQELFDKKDVLINMNIKWIEDGRRFLCCGYCGTKELDFNFQKLQQHHLQHHILPSRNEPIFKVKTTFHSKGYFKSEKYKFEEEKKNFELVEGPRRLMTSMGVLIGIFRLRAIPKCKAQLFYEIASWLEREGNEKERSKAIQGTRMVMYGIFKKRSRGWFTHTNNAVYAVAEEFIRDVVSDLRIAFPEEMENFEKILLDEGLDGEEGRYGGTPFSCFSITRDYNCFPHDDDKDYGFGIIIWLYPQGDIQVEHLPTFWLNDHEVKLRPPNGSAFFFNAKTTWHCTTSTIGAGVLGLAFVQKIALVTQVKEVLHNKESKDMKKKYEENRELWQLPYPEAIFEM